MLQWVAATSCAATPYAVAMPQQPEDPVFLCEVSPGICRVTTATGMRALRSLHEDAYKLARASGELLWTPRLNISFESTLRSRT